MTKETKKCPYCGEEILAIAKKCKHCGQWLEVECPFCAEIISANLKICPHCNSHLNAKQSSFEITEKKEKDILVTAAVVNDDEEDSRFTVYEIFRIIFLILLIIMAFKFDFSAAVCAAIVFEIYFIPSEIASSRRHPNATIIFIINLFFGCTLIGWVITLIMAISKFNNKIQLNCNIKEDKD